MSSSSSTNNPLVSAFKLRSNVASFNTLEARACSNGDIAVFDVSQLLVQKTKHLDPNQTLLPNATSTSTTTTTTSEPSSSSSSPDKITRNNYLPFLYNESENAHSAMISGATFSLDGSVIATTSEDMKTKIWGVTHGELRGTLTAPGVLYSVTFVPGGRYLMTSCHNGATLLFSTASGRVKAVLQGGHGKESFILCSAASSDGKFLATGSQDGSVCVWKCDPIVLVTSPTAAQDGGLAPVTNSSISFNNNYNSSASNNDLTSASINNNNNNSELKFTLYATHEEHTDSVFSCKFLPVSTSENNNNNDKNNHGDHVLVTGGADGNIILWSVREKSVIKKNNLKCGTIFSIAIHPRINSDISSFTLLDKNKNNSNDSISLNTKLFCVGTEVGVLAYVHSETLERFEILKGSTQPIAAVDFHPDGDIIASASEDGKVLLWNVETKEMVASLQGHKGAVYCCSFSPVGEFLVTAGEDKAIRVWNVRGGKNLARFKGCKSHCGVFAEKYEFGDDGETLVAVGSDEKPVCKWNVQSGKVSFVRDDIEEYKKQQEEQDRRQQQQQQQVSAPSLAKIQSSQSVPDFQQLQLQQSSSASFNNNPNQNQAQRSGSPNVTTNGNGVHQHHHHQQHHHHHHHHHHHASANPNPQAMLMIQQLQRQCQMLDAERKELINRLQGVQSEMKKQTDKHDESLKEQTDMIKQLMAEKEALTKQNDDAEKARASAEEKAQEEREKRTALRRTARDDIYLLETQKIDLTKRVKDLSKEITSMKEQNRVTFDEWTKHLIEMEDVKRASLAQFFEVDFCKHFESLMDCDHRVTQFGISLEAHRQIHMGTLMNIEEMEVTVETANKQVEKTREEMRKSEERAAAQIERLTKERDEGFAAREKVLSESLVIWKRQLVESERDARQKLIVNDTLDEGEGALTVRFAELFDIMMTHSIFQRQTLQPVKDALKKEQSEHRDTADHLKRIETALGFSQKVVADLRVLEVNQAQQIRNLEATTQSQMSLRQVDADKLTGLEEQVGELTRSLTTAKKEHAAHVENLSKQLHISKNEHAAAVSQHNEDKIKLQQEITSTQSAADAEMKKVMARITEFEKELTSLAASLESSEKENEQKKLALAELEQEKQIINQKLAQAMSFGLVLKQKLDHQKEELDEKERLLSEERKRASDMQKEVHATNSACTARIDELQASHTTALSAEIQKQRDLVAKADKAEKEETRVRGEFDRLSKEKQQMEQRSLKIESERSELASKLEEAKKNETFLTASLNAEVQKRQAAEQHVESIRKASHDDSQKSTSSFVAAEKKAEDAEKERRAMEHKLADSVTYAATLSRSMSSLIEEKQKLEAALESMKQEREAEKQQLHISKNEHAAAVSRLSEEKIKLQQEITASDADMKKLRARITEFEKELTSLAASLESSEKENEQKKLALEELEQEKQNINQKLAQAMSFGLVLKEKLDQQKLELDEKARLLSDRAEKEETRARSEFDRMSKEKQQLEQRLLKMESERSELASKLEEAKKNESFLTSSLNAEVQKTTTMSSSLISLIEENQKLESALEPMKKEREAEKQKLQQQQVAFEKSLEVEKAKNEDSIRRLESLLAQIRNEKAETELSLKKEREQSLQQLQQEQQQRTQLESSLDDKNRLLEQMKQEHAEKVQDLADETARVEKLLAEAKAHGILLVESLKTEKQKREVIESEKADVESRLKQATTYGSKIVQAHKEESAQRRAAEEKIRELEKLLGK